MQQFTILSAVDTYKNASNARLWSSLHICTDLFTIMQFFKSTVVAVLACVAVASAAATPDMESLEARECKPLLQSCQTNSPCCSKLCVLGVRLMSIYRL